MVFKCQEDSFLKERKSTSDEELYFNKSLIVIFDYGSPLSQLDFRIAVNEFLQKIRGLIHLAIRLENGGKRTLLSDIETNSSRAEYNIKRAQAEKKFPIFRHCCKRLDHGCTEEKLYLNSNDHFTSKVVKCELTKEPIVEYGKTSKFEGYQVTLENTILFPAGGGQPHDTGFLNNLEVLQVLRKGDEALHFTKEPIEVGTVVKQKINWVRRFDHMQQHTGQHLLSALLDKEKIFTTSWWLGAEESYVELDCPKICNEIINATEEKCNELIRAAIPVNVKICKSDDPELDEAHTRGLPKDCMETIRIICIGNIDENMCCGTHVSNLSQLQVIKLTGVEPGKRGKTNLKFLVGNRVIRTMQQMFDREKAITGLLKNDSSKHEELIQKLQKNFKISSKSLQNVLLELAQNEVDKIKSSNPRPKFVFIFKKESTPEFNRAIIKGLDGEDIFMFLASEEPDKLKEGQIIIQGPKEQCNALGSQITDLLKCKGAFKNGTFQGKAGDMGGINKCKKLIEDYFNNI